MIAEYKFDYSKFFFFFFIIIIIIIIKLIYI